MAFQELLAVFEAQESYFPNFLADLASTGHSYEALKKRLSLDYDLAEEWWDVVRSMPSKVRVSPRVHNGLHLLQSIDDKWSSPAGKIVDGANIADLGKCKEGNAHKFVHKMISSKVYTFDQVMLEHCQDQLGPNIKNFFYAIGGSYSPIESSVWVDEASPRTFELHVARVSRDPKIQTIRFMRDLDKERKSRKPPSGEVIFKSWLAQERFLPHFRRWGLGPEQGLKIEEYDMNELVKRPNKRTMPELGYFDLVSLMGTCLYSIVQSPNNLRAFLIKGELPRIGIISIPAEVFYSKAPSPVQSTKVNTPKIAEQGFTTKEEADKDKETRLRREIELLRGIIGTQSEEIELLKKLVQIKRL